jgi:hypothetical protein
MFHVQSPAVIEYLDEHRQRELYPVFYLPVCGKRAMIMAKDAMEVADRIDLAVEIFGPRHELVFGNS